MIEFDKLKAKYDALIAEAQQVYAQMQNIREDRDTKLMNSAVGRIYRCDYDGCEPRTTYKTICKADDNDKYLIYRLTVYPNAETQISDYTYTAEYADMILENEVETTLEELTQVIQKCKEHYGNSLDAFHEKVRKNIENRIDSACSEVVK